MQLTPIIFFSLADTVGKVQVNTFWLLRLKNDEGVARGGINPVFPPVVVVVGGGGGCGGSEASQTLP